MVETPATASEEHEEQEARLHGHLVSRSRGQQVAHPDRGGYFELVRALRDEDGFRLCADLTAVDHLVNHQRRLLAGITPQRFEVVVNLLAMETHQRVRVLVQVPEDNPVVASLYDLFPGTEAMEREVYDLFGIVFTGHPDLSRILMPDDWEGHPLRKDYGVGRIPVQFKGAPG